MSDRTRVKRSWPKISTPNTSVRGFREVQPGKGGRRCGRAGQREQQVPGPGPRFFFIVSPSGEASAMLHLAPPICDGPLVIDKGSVSA